MSTNDEVRVDIHENENVETSPQEHNNVMDTTTASQNQSSKEEIVEIRTSPLQDQVVRITIVQENELHEKNDELVTSPPERTEIIENVASPPHEDPTTDNSRRDRDFEKLYKAALDNDWNTAYNDVFMEDPLKYFEYFSSKRVVDGNTLLHEATKANSFLFAKGLVNYMTEDQLTIKNHYGNSPFFVAALYGRVEIATVMFEKNKELANIRGNGNMEMLPIHAAARRGNKEMVEFLYGIQGPLEKIDSNRLFLNWMNRVSLSDDPRINEYLEKLYILTRRNDWDTTYRNIFKEDPIENSKYLTARISVNEDTTLHVAIETQSFTFAEELIQYMTREDLAIKNSDGNTAFFLVATSENVRLAKQMFEKNSELPYIHGAKQMLPIHIAVGHGQKLMVEFLYRIQGPLQEMDSNKLFAIASKHGSCEEIIENVASRPLTNQADDPRITEIHRIMSNAAMYNDWNTTYRSIFKGDPFKNSKYLTSKISKKGDNALHLATKNNSVEFVEEIIHYMLKEELTITNDDGDTAFLLAAGNGMVDVARVLFEKNRWLPSIRGYSNDLPIHRAAKLGHREMIEFLYGIQGPLQEIDSSRLFFNLRNRVSLFVDSYDSWAINRNLEELYIAASRNDWSGAYNYIFESDPLKNSTYLTARISEEEDTALHIAAKTKSFTFFEELLKYMKKEHLAIKNTDGNSAFFLIAASGDVRLAKEMFEKDVELPVIRGEKEMLPIHKAAEQGHKLMVEFLYGIQGPLQEMDSNKLSDYGREGKHIIKKLYRAAFNDDWKTARKLFEDYPDYTKAQMSQEGDMALHIAVAAQSSMFVQNWVNTMNPEDLEIKNYDGNTAFHLAAASGNLELAKKMFDKNRELRSIRGEKEMLPINIAAQSGHKEVVKFLYEDFLSISIEDKYINEVDHCKLIHSLIRAGIYDFALKLLKEKPEFATCRDESNGETVLHILARKPNFPNKKGSRSDKVRHEKLPLEARELVQWLWQQILDLNLDEDKFSEIIDHPWPLIFDAVEKQNINFLAILIREFPKLIARVNGNNYSIFHIAVLNRQKEIFELIHDIDPELKKSILEKEDDEKNNILHLAAMMPPQERLNIVSGVALQLQQELFWFKEVNKIVDQKHVGAKNKKERTPRDIHNEKITTLKDKGEKWMKDTANSCMIVATLITTVVFAAAFTVPGGIKEDTGNPNFIQKVSFTMFVISDAISLVSSSCSILIFLSILTSRYADEDFLEALPIKLVVGLSTLFFSIAAMMVVFCTTIFVVYKDGKIWVPILVTVFASLPVILFTHQQWKLIYDVTRSTFQTSDFSKINKQSLINNDDENKKKSWNLKKRKDAAGWNFLVKYWDFIHYKCSNFLEECWNSTYNRFFD